MFYVFKRTFFGELIHTRARLLTYLVFWRRKSKVPYFHQQFLPFKFPQPSETMIQFLITKREDYCNNYRISANSFRGNYSFLNLTLCSVTFGHFTYRCGNYSRAETIRRNTVFGSNWIKSDIRCKNKNCIKLGLIDLSKGLVPHPCPILSLVIFDY